MERPGLAINGLRVRLVGNLPTAVRSANKLARLQGIRSGLGVEVHHLAIDGLGERRVSDDPVAVGSLHCISHAHLL